MRLKHWQWRLRRAASRGFDEFDGRTHPATWHGRVILVDTGPIVAVINDRDDHHRECMYLLERLPGPLLIPATVASLCMCRSGRQG